MTVPRSACSPLKQMRVPMLVSFDWLRVIANNSLRIVTEITSAPIFPVEPTVLAVSNLTAGNGIFGCRDGSLKSA